MKRDGRACPAQTLRTDRTKPHHPLQLLEQRVPGSAAELVPSRASLEWNFKQSSPSACGGPHLLSKCGIPALSDSRCKLGHPSMRL